LQNHRITKRSEPYPAGALCGGGQKNTWQGRHSDGVPMMFRDEIVAKSELVGRGDQPQPVLVELAEGSVALVDMVEDAELHRPRSRTP
jgi:hypothetical protein